MLVLHRHFSLLHEKQPKRGKDEEKTASIAQKKARKNYDMAAEWEPEKSKHGKFMLSAINFTQNNQETMYVQCTMYTRNKHISVF